MAERTSVERRGKGRGIARLWQPTDSGATNWGGKLRKIENGYCEMADKLRLDRERVMFGVVIGCIWNDDVNSFTGPLLKYIPEFSRLAKTEILERLKWEGGQGGLPNELREKIKQVREYMVGSSWSSQGGVREAYDYWKTNLHDWLDDEVVRNKVYQEAHRDYKLVYEVLHPSRRRN